MMKTPPPILFRIVGKSGDGVTVTLGKYHTLAEAESDQVRFVKQAYYRDVTIHEVAPPPPPRPRHQRMTEPTRSHPAGFAS